MATMMRSDDVTSSDRVRIRISKKLCVVDTPQGAGWNVGPRSAPMAIDQSDLDDVERLAVNAWAALQMQRAPIPSHAWNAPGHKEPIHLHGSKAEDVLAAPAGAPEPERFLCGSVAVGVVIVTRDQGPEVITKPEQQRLVQEVLEGLNFLSGAEPKAKITFDLDIQVVTIDVDPAVPGASHDPYERLEAPWRDAALGKLGLPNGRAGYKKHAADVKANWGTRWAFTAFFTKYPVHHFAYAVYEKVVMHYDNDGWGIDNLNRVFAHEACHIFGAADEYGNCDCGPHGKLREDNRNCINCTTNQATCLMNSNDLKLCDHSRRQLGWDASLFPP